MKTNLNFTLANFQDHSGYVDYWDDCPCCSSERWTHKYETDLCVDGKVVGKAYTYHDHCTADTNFTLDGVTWYSVAYNSGYEHVTKRLGENGKESEVPTSNRVLLSDSECLVNLESLSTSELLKRLIDNKDNTEYDDVMLVLEHLEALVAAVAAKEPPKKS